MAARARVLTALSAVALALLPAAREGADAAAPARVERLVVVDARGDLVAAAPSGARERLTRLGRDSDPAVSPDGRRIAFVRAGAVHVLDLWTRKTARLAPGASPAWSPDGRVAFAAADGVILGGEVIAAGAREAAWAADGRLATVDGEGVRVGGTVVVPTGRSPAWSPQGRLAAVTPDGVVVDGTLVVPGGDRPSWSPSGSRIAFERDGGIWTAAADGADVRPAPGTLAGDRRPAWSRLALAGPDPKPPVRVELLPDLDQRAPSGLRVVSSRGRFQLGFTSATDNLGRGPLWIRASRAGAPPWMAARQLIRLRGGGTRLVPDVGVVRFVDDPPHHHWHLMRFQTFELRRASDFDLVVRDAKTGFCLADRYGGARSRVRGRAAPRFLGNCGQNRRSLRGVEMGTSVGYTDRYPAHFHGQSLDLTGVPGGVYVLVHRANPLGAIREVRYDNNAASLRIRISWPRGRASVPRVGVLRACERSERCGPG